MMKRNAFALALCLLMLVAFVYSFWVNAAH
jgi:hypothetical protein